jgi:hypothetical protein
VDLELLAKPASLDHSFWLEALNCVVDRFHPDDLFFLNRPVEQQPRFETINNLFAPNFDLRCSLVEDRRLASLCSELAIDVFMSTQYTSAGANVKSVFVALDSMPKTFEQDPDIRESGIRAATLAAFHAAASPSAAQHLSQFAGVGPEFCRPFKSPRDLPGMIADIHHSTVHPVIHEINCAEEFKTSAEMEQLHTSSDEEAELKWQEARRNAGQLPLVPRLWKAVRSVHRYPEYLRRILP